MVHLNVAARRVPRQHCTAGAWQAQQRDPAARPGRHGRGAIETSDFRIPQLVPAPIAISQIMPAPSHYQ